MHGLTLSALTLAARKEHPALLGTKRQRDIFEAISAILGFGFGREWMEKNPFCNRQLLDLLPKGETHKPKQFEPDELAGLLNSEEFHAKRYFNDDKNRDRSERI